MKAKSTREQNMAKEERRNKERNNKRSSAGGSSSLDFELETKSEAMILKEDLKDSSLRAPVGI